MSEPIFLNYALAGHPLLWVETYEEYRAMTVFAREMTACKEKKHLFSWNRGDGIKSRTLKDGVLETAKVVVKTEGVELDDPVAALDWAADSLPPDGILFLLDFHTYGKKDYVCRKIKNLLPKFMSAGKMLVIVSHTVDIPPELEKDTTVVHFKLPGREDLVTILKSICESNKAQYPKEDNDIIEAAQGLTWQEAMNAFAMSLVEKKEFNAELIRREKSSVVRKTGLLEVVESKVSLDEVGGLENIKAWLRARQNSFTDKAREFGVVPPKGALFVGVPGTGKSLISKAVSVAWGRPLLRLDIGKCMGSYVGESEGNLRKVLAIAEAVSPCLIAGTQVLMADGSRKAIDTLYKTKKDGNFKVMAFDGERLIPTNVLKVTKRNSDVNFMMGYSNGSSIGYSWNHPQPVMRNGIMSWVQTQEVKVGDFVGLPVGPINTSPTEFLRYLPKDSRFYSTYGKKKVRIRSSYDKATAIVIGRGGWTDSILHVWPRIIDERFLRLLGMILSDGHITKKGGRVGFTNTNPTLINEFKSLVFDLFGKVCKEKTLSKEEMKATSPLLDIPYGNFKACTVAYITSKLIKQILLSVKDQLCGFNEKLLGAFLSGYLDGDGCVMPGRYPRIIFCSKKKEVSDLLRSILTRVGIISSKGDSNGVAISGSQCYRLKDLLTPRHMDKKRKLYSISTPIFYADRVRVYPIGLLLRSIRESVGLKTHHFKSCSSSEVFAWENSQRPVPENRLLNIIGELESRFPGSAEPLKAIVSSTLKWVRTVSKKPIRPQPVYDLCCEGIHNFVAEGILTHNCVLWLDELEKSLAGSKGSESDGHGTTKRVFGTLLTWMSEKTADVFIAATANNVAAIPPELLRAGRFDITFWVDLPTAKQRQEIISIHLKKVKRDPAKFNFKKLLDISADYTGAELETWVKEALNKAFDEGHELCTEDLVGADRGHHSDFPDDEGGH